MCVVAVSWVWSGDSTEVLVAVKVAGSVRGWHGV